MSGIRGLPVINNALIAMLVTIAELFAKSGLMPQELRTKEAVFTVLLAGAELGLKPMQAVRAFHIIDRQIVPSADLIVALVKRSEVCEYFTLVGVDERGATYETKRRGAGKSQRMDYTIEDAKRAGLAQRNVWRKHTTSMLRARCASRLAKDVYPEVVIGLEREVELSDEEAVAGDDAREEVDTASVERVAVVAARADTPDEADIESVAQELGAPADPTSALYEQRFQELRGVKAKGAAAIAVKALLRAEVFESEDVAQAAFRAALVNRGWDGESAVSVEEIAATWVDVELDAAAIDDEKPDQPIGLSPSVHQRYSTLESITGPGTQRKRIDWACGWLVGTGHYTKEEAGGELGRWLRDHRGVGSITEASSLQLAQAVEALANATREAAA